MKEKMRDWRFDKFKCTAFTLQVKSLVLMNYAPQLHFNVDEIGYFQNACHSYVHILRREACTRLDECQ
jgi:hypothetical protein